VVVGAFVVGLGVVVASLVVVVVGAAVVVVVAALRYETALVAVAVFVHAVLT
jgi:hypothetical protein